MARGLECAAHVHASVVPQELHHVFPKQYHGPDVASNLTLICCNAHSDVHYMLDAMLKQKSIDLRTYGIGVRAIAHRGYDAVMAYAQALSTGR